MREYKFRGKRIDNGEWVYGNLFLSKCVDKAWIIEEIDISNDTFAGGWSFPKDLMNYYEVDPATVGQFTGRKDKFGTQIYETDIVKQTYHAERGSVHDGSDESFDGHHLGKVVITSSKGVCMKNPLCYSDDTGETITTNQYKSVSGRRCEVIGNIHSNPELLEVKA